jgi:predicted nucleic acid-binding protein
MTAADSSVIVAAFASWHEHHEPARRSLRPGARVVGHSALEAYSVLTRLPAPHRARDEVVRDFLAARFPDPYLTLDGKGYLDLVRKLAALGITGGASYDALIATTALQADATLLTCDRRAVDTYQRCGARISLVQHLDQA